MARCRLIVVQFDDELSEEPLLHFFVRVVGVRTGSTGAHSVQSLAAPADEGALVAELRRLSMAETTALLALVVQWLNAHDALPRERLQARFKGAVPALPALLDWTAHLLDAHFAALILAPDSHALIVEARAGIDHCPC